MGLKIPEKDVESLVEEMFSDVIASIKCYDCRGRGCTRCNDGYIQVSLICTNSRCGRVNEEEWPECAHCGEDLRI